MKDQAGPRAHRIGRAIPLVIAFVALAALVQAPAAADRVGYYRNGAVYCTLRDGSVVTVPFVATTNRRGYLTCRALPRPLAGSAKYYLPRGSRVEFNAPIGARPTVRDHRTPITEEERARKGRE